jgi:hypothetical protein
MRTRAVRYCSCISTLVLILVFAASGQALEFGVRGYYWYPSLQTSDVRLDSGGTQGTEFNFKDDFDISNKGIPSVEAFAGVGNHHFSLMYSQVKYSGTASNLPNTTFGGKTYSGSVSGDLNFTMLDADYQYDLLNLKNILAGFAVGPILKVKYLEGEAKLSNAAQGETSQTFRLPVPMVGVGANVGILANLLEARAKVTGMGYSGNYIYEGLADISVTPFPFVDIHGGYKVMGVKVDNQSDVTANVRFQGPFVALTIGW